MSGACSRGCLPAVLGAALVALQGCGEQSPNPGVPPPDAGVDIAKPTLRLVMAGAAKLGGADVGGCSRGEPPSGDGHRWCVVYRPSPADAARTELWVVDDDKASRARSILKKTMAPLASVKKSWTCNGCGEMIEGQFSECWNCGCDRAGVKSRGVVKLTSLSRRR